MMTASTLVDQARDFQTTLDSGALKRSDLARFIAQVGEGNALVLRNLERALICCKTSARSLRTRPASSAAVLTCARSCRRC